MLFGQGKITHEGADGFYRVSSYARRCWALYI
jgi:hypothetical protein